MEPTVAGRVASTTPFGVLEAFEKALLAIVGRQYPLPQGSFSMFDAWLVDPVREDLYTLEEKGALVAFLRPSMEPFTAPD